MNIDNLRTCSKCNKVLPLIDFVPSKRCSTGYTNTCKECMRMYQHNWQLQHSEQHRISQRNYRHKNPNRVGKSSLANRDRYHRLLKEQCGTCAICGGSPKERKSGNGNNFDLDHNHCTGEFRGVLCRGCNLMVGLLERSNIDLHKVQEYLVQYG